MPQVSRPEACEPPLRLVAIQPGTQQARPLSKELQTEQHFVFLRHSAHTKVRLLIKKHRFSVQ